MATEARAPADPAAERCEGGAIADDRFAAFLSLLQSYSVVTSRIEARLDAAGGLSLPEHEVLVRLAEAPEHALKMVELAGLVLLSKSGITRLVDRLEARGLIRREPSRSDRRIVLAHLTRAGEELIDELRPVLADAIDDFFSSHLSDGDIAGLRRGLRKVLVGNGEWVRERCSPANPTAATGGT